jgi:tetratricopeptide (TPR) repeat protein
VTDLAGRYNLATSPDWQALLTHFELGEGFAFIVLLVPDQQGADVCRDELKGFLAQRGETLLEVPAGTPDALREIAGTLLDLAAGESAGAVFVSRAVPEAAEDYREWRDAWREGAARLNQFRNPLRRQFTVPLIFAGAPWLQEVLREAAPDLWSVRTLVAWVEPAWERVSVPQSPDIGRTGRGPDPELAMSEAERLRGKPGSEAALARLLYRAGLGFNAQGEWMKAVRAFTESLEVRRQIGAPAPDIAVSSLQLARVLRLLGHYDSSLSYLEQARDSCEASEKNRLLADYVAELGRLAARRCDVDTARRNYEEASKLYLSVGDIAGQADCLHELGRLAVNLGDPQVGEQAIQEAHELYRQSGGALGTAFCCLSLGDAALVRSEFTIAIERYQEALSQYLKVGDPLGVANATFDLGLVAFHQGDLAEAQLRCETALAKYTDLNHVLGKANSNFLFGAIIAKQCCSERARTYYEAALSVYERLGNKLFVGLTCRSLAQVATGEERAAYIERAREAWKSIGRQDLIDDLEKSLSSPAARPDES